LTPHATT